MSQKTLHKFTGAICLNTYFYVFFQANERIRKLDLKTGKFFRVQCSQQRIEMNR